MFILVYIFAWLFCIYVFLFGLYAMLGPKRIIEWAKITFTDKSWQL